MPVIMFTQQEVVSTLLAQARETSAKILELSDLERKPLNPGESPDNRRHEIARLGKKLAELFQGVDGIIGAVMSQVDDESPVATDATNPPSN